MSDLVESGETEQAAKPLPQASGYSWYVLSVLVVVYILNFIDRQILSILAVDIKADLGLDDSDLGFLGGAAFAVFYALFGIPLGRLADNWSRVKLLSIGLTLWSLMTALSGFARNQVELTLRSDGSRGWRSDRKSNRLFFDFGLFPQKAARNGARHLFVWTLHWRRRITVYRRADRARVERALIQLADQWGWLAGKRRFLRSAFPG